VKALHEADKLDVSVIHGDGTSTAANNWLRVRQGGRLQEVAPATTIRSFCLKKCYL
jgi:hypothetical protein